MATSLPEFTTALTAEICNEMDKAQVRIRHCVDQLTDEQVWHRSGKGMNSIANVLIHLAGNMRQWLINGLRETPDVRDRPGEFSDESRRPKADLLSDLARTVAEAQDVIRQLSADDMLRVRRIQGFAVTGLAAIFDSVPHLRGHAQEIVRATRAILGDKYRFAWVPQTKEEGAPG